MLLLEKNLERKRGMLRCFTLVPYVAGEVHELKQFWQFQIDPSAAQPASYKFGVYAGRNPSGLDYLEKIIQLPYRLPPVDKHTAMDRYIKAQMGMLKEDDVLDKHPSEQPVDLRATNDEENADRRDRLD